MTGTAKVTAFDAVCHLLNQGVENARTPEEKAAAKEKINNEGQGMLLRAAARDGNCIFFHMVFEGPGHQYLTQEILDEMFLNCGLKHKRCHPPGDPCFLLSIDRELLLARIKIKKVLISEEEFEKLYRELREDGTLPSISKETIRRRIAILIEQGELSMVEYFKSVLEEEISEAEQEALFYAILEKKPFGYLFDLARRAPHPLTQEQAQALSQAWLKKEGIRIK